MKKWLRGMAALLLASTTAFAGSGASIDTSDIKTIFGIILGLALLAGAVLVVIGIISGVKDMLGRDSGSGVGKLIFSLLGGVVIAYAVPWAISLTGVSIQATMQ